MSKYTWLAVIIVYLIIVTFLVDATTLSTTAEVGRVTDIPEGVSVITVWTMLGTFWDILWFRIEGMPAIVNLVAFYPPAIVVLVIVLDIIVEALPF